MGGLTRLEEKEEVQCKKSSNHGTRKEYRGAVRSKSGSCRESGHLFFRIGACI